MSFGYGFGAAVLTLVGLAAGAGRLDRMRAFVTRSAALAVVTLGIPDCWCGGGPPSSSDSSPTTRASTPSAPNPHHRSHLSLIGITMVVAFAFQGLGRAAIPLALTIVRVAGVLAVAVLCTHRFGLGDAAVFKTIAVGNLVSAAGMVAMFALVERRVRAGLRPAAIPVELAATGTR